MGAIEAVGPLPSQFHEVLIDLFRGAPRRVAELLRYAGLAIPDGMRARALSETFSDLQPPSYHADLVLAFEQPDGVLARAAVVEIQLARDPDKDFTWPQYVVGQRLRLRVVVDLVVVAPAPEVARWCATPIAIDDRGCILRPLVLGPETIPPVTDPDQARAFPELALLSVAAHGRGPAAEAVGRAALTGCDVLDSARIEMYADFILTSLSREVAHKVSATMNPNGYEIQSEVLRELIDRWRREGCINERQHILRKQLGRRFGAVPAQVIARIEAADADQLDRWLDRILDAPTLDDVFAEPPAAD
jgi:hypothetical protein